MKVFANNEEFNGAIASGVVMVDVFATWCGPCQVLAPAFEEVANEMADKATFAKVDIDLMPEMPTKYGIMTVPTLMVFKDGEVAEQVSAVLSKDAMKSMILKHV